MDPGVGGTHLSGVGAFPASALVTMPGAAGAAPNGLG